MKNDKIMRKLASILAFFMVTFTMNAQEKQETQVDSNAPVITFESEVIDYGTIDQGSNGERVFKFTNTGKSPLVISNIKSTCGCTVPKAPKDPIMPGESGTIKVTYDTKRLNGFSKMIMVYSNADTPVKRIRIKGIVVKPESAVMKKKSTVSSK